ncbi:universal stress protein [Arthrobacter sp. BE255]|uniref:universal stress protein n=1 Tax=Arthrobacter sp. BE255 TaxID=2817721 RepID=UPI0028556B89|nr:universal stress protein [Arthrobacter sp. BE255]MDR7161960.1 nucleotide-binding universal stress UspA family protein [Arthrobacter sp. BE255]
MSIVMIHRSSRDDAAALTAAQELSRERGEDLVIMAASSGSHAEGAADLEYQAFVDQVRHHLDNRIQWRAELIAPGDDPTEALVEQVQAIRPSVAVIGTHHRSAVGKLIFGHDLQRLLMDIEVPILLIKSRRK